MGDNIVVDRLCVLIMKNSISVDDIFVANNIIRSTFVSPTLSSSICKFNCVAMVYQ